MGLEKFTEDGGGVFAKFAVFGTESGAKVRVDIELADHLAFYEDRNDNLGFGFERTCKIPGIGVDVVHDDGFAG